MPLIGSIGWPAPSDGAASFRSKLSYRLVTAVADFFPGSVRVRDVGLARAEDNSVWRYAREAGLAIVTKDSDFNQAAFLVRPAPNIVWLRLGNCTTDDVVMVLKRRAAAIDNFTRAGEDVLLMIDR